jgi:hypothetical protein
VDLILRQQIEDIASGIPPSSRVVPAQMPASRRRDLKDALAQLRNLNTTVRDLLFRG